MEHVTARQCAARWGISAPRARHILAPLDSVGRDTETGAKLYRQDEAEDAHANRPGRGTRTDRTTTVMPDEQFEQLITDNSIPAAHRALWSLLRDGHARITDALALTVGDVDLDQGAARLAQPKLVRDPRAIPVSERSVELLRQAKGDRDMGLLITGTHGRPLSRESATRVARQAGAASIHAFRPAPHNLGEPPQFGVTRVRAKKVRPGDTVFLPNGRSINVASVQSAKGPDGRLGIEFNVADGFPFLFTEAEALVTIAVRDEAE